MSVIKILKKEDWHKPSKDVWANDIHIQIGFDKKIEVESDFKYETTGKDKRAWYQGQWFIFFTNEKPTEDISVKFIIKEE